MACASLFYHFFGALEGGVDVGTDVLFAQFVAENASEIIMSDKGQQTP